MWNALLRRRQHVGRDPGPAADARGTASRAPSAAASRGAPRRPTPTRPRPADLVERDFSATRPDRAVGVRFHAAALLGRRAVLRVRHRRLSRRVVGWQLAPHMRDTLVIDALRMAAQPTPRQGADVELVRPQRRRKSVHQLRPRPGPRRSRRAAVDRDRRRRAGQRPGRIVRGLLQDRAHPRSRLAAAGPAWSSRSSSTSAGSTTTACTAPSATSHPPSSKPDTHHASSAKFTHQYNSLKQRSRAP